ncbi:YbjQ family protein [Salibaculum griseiflavum]|uniref:YbjQ family protein n=1 Tax=Salibaculum griseiflavum TaxID=1914409 RepID=A0A2V1P148_9RHOB|nr:heavy metal-binding domain-containing protein [Salibaculum griseiflavum]PWG16251.1 YbjQ family protein [Salibaculum griseiflavum]
MAKCNICESKIGFFDEQKVEGVCSECKAKIEKVVLTTETYPERMNITDTIEVITAECAFGMNMFKDLFAGVRNITGGRSEAVQKTIRDSRRTALYELKKEAYEVGANAVVGIDLDYVELSGAGNMVRGCPDGC